MIDFDLAALYGVSTKRLNEQVKRNKRRFPKDFTFQLSLSEKKEVVANCDHLRSLKYSPVRPRVFTEHGALMAAQILQSRKAIQMSIYVIRAFVRLRETFAANQILAGRLAEIEKVLMDHDVTLRDLCEKIRLLILPETPALKRRIGFHSHRSPSE